MDNKGKKQITLTGIVAGTVLTLGVTAAGIFGPTKDPAPNADNNQNTNIVVGSTIEGNGIIYNGPQGVAPYQEVEKKGEDYTIKH